MKVGLGFKKRKDRIEKKNYLQFFHHLLLNPTTLGPNHGDRSLVAKDLLQIFKGHAPNTSMN